jgi:hypothetical protein
VIFLVPITGYVCTYLNHLNPHELVFVRARGRVLYLVQDEL